MIIRQQQKTDELTGAGATILGPVIYGTIPIPGRDGEEAGKMDTWVVRKGSTAEKGKQIS